MRWLEASEFDSDRVNGYWCVERFEEEVFYTIVGIRLSKYEEQDGRRYTMKGTCYQERKRKLEGIEQQ